MARIATAYWSFMGFCRRLQRGGAAVGLFVLLTIGLFEPLACILHCEVWTLLYGQDPRVAAHQHHHGVGQGGVAAGGAFLCQLHDPSGDPASRPGPMPAPFHEMVLIAAILVLALALIERRPAAPQHAPPRRALAPPLRPPISFA